MFAKPTVLILGAGASSEAGMPLGSALLTTIAESVRFGFQWSDLVSGDPDLWNLLTRTFGIERANQFSEAGNALASAAMRYSSIDEALHLLNGNPDAVSLGKFAIVNAISKAEADSALSRDQRSGRVDVSSMSKTWYAHFLSMALAGLTKDQLTGMFRNVTVVNFNYDRTLECYIYNSLVLDLGIGRNEAKKIVRSLATIRPYGSLGPFEPERGDALCLVPDVIATADGIRTFTEKQEEDVIKQISEVLNPANVVLLLGFGFHSQNLKLLRAEPGAPRGATVFATSKGIHVENHAGLTTILARCFGANSVKLLDMTAAQLLSELRPSISSAIA